MGSTYNYIAPLYHELIKSYDEGNFEKARSLQQKSIDFITLLGKYGGIATGKAYMKLAGIDCGEFSLPVYKMTDEAFETFKKEVMALGFKNFSS